MCFIEPFPYYLVNLFRRHIVNPGISAAEDQMKNSLFSFFMITNCWKLRSLKEYKFIISHFLDEKSNKDFTRTKSRCLQGCIPSRGSESKSISLPFTASRASPAPCSVTQATFLHLQSQQLRISIRLCFCSHIPLPRTRARKDSLLLKNLCD